MRLTLEWRRGTNAGFLFFGLTSALTAADQAKLVLHIDGSSASFAFSDARGPISDQTYDWSGTGLDWTSTSEVTLRLREAAVSLSTDATLSDLVVNDGNADLTLTPTFASDMYTYRASVANTVTEVTVTPTKNDSGATIEYLDANNMTLTDADTGVTGQQVAVAVGDTIIGVKVTAEDGDTTQTYTVTVNRAAATPPDCTLNTGDLWCGVVAVGQIELSDRGVVEYGFKGTTIGDLLDNDGDKTFAIGAEFLHD